MDSGEDSEVGPGVDSVVDSGMDSVVDSVVDSEVDSEMKRALEWTLWRTLEKCRRLQNKLWSAVSIKNTDVVKYLRLCVEKNIVLVECLRL